MNYKRLTALSAALLFASTANAEWKYGVGTGLGLASYDGDVTIDGTAKLDVEYDQDDFEGGFGGAASQPMALGYSTSAAAPSNTNPKTRSKALPRVAQRTTSSAPLRNSQSAMSLTAKTRSHSRLT